MGNTKMTDKQKVTTMANSDYVFGNFGGKVGQMSIPYFRSHLYDDSTDDDSPELSALKSRISSVEDKNTEQDTRINALLQDTPWEGMHMNMFTETGEYHIHGERTDANDGLPILNEGTIEARLTVLDSSITNGTGEKTDTVITQILRLSNRTGGDGHVYVRTAQAATKSQLATPSSTAWGTWEKLMGMFEKNAVTNIADLDTYTTNGMYSGLFQFEGVSDISGGVEMSTGSTFLMITINGYAVASKGLTPQLTQMLYLLPAKDFNAPAKMYLRTAYWNKEAEPKAWVFANWDRLAMASEISGGGGGSIEEYNRLIELIAANTTKIETVESTANDAKSAAENAQTAADTAQETATAASTAAQEAKTAAETAQSTANGKQDALTLTVKDNGNIVLANIQGQSKEFMPATPSGDPMHYAYVAAGAEYNNTGADIVKDAPWADLADDDADKTVVHKAGYWYLNGLGDITNEQMCRIYMLTGSNQNYLYGYCNGQDVRTNIMTIRDIEEVPSNLITAVSGLRRCSIEVLKVWTKVYYEQGSVSYFNLLYVENLKFIIGIFKASKEVSGRFIYKLKGIKIFGLYTSATFPDAKKLSMKSVLYMINNEKAKSPITITLHADVYNRCMANEDILAALETHTNISIASA